MLALHVSMTPCCTGSRSHRGTSDYAVVGNTSLLQPEVISLETAGDLARKAAHVQSFRALQAGSVNLGLFAPLSLLSGVLLLVGFLLYRRTMDY